MEKVIVDYWPFAEDDEKWGVEVYENEEDDDPVEIFWYKTQEKAERCADYFIPLK